MTDLKPCPIDHRGVEYKLSILRTHLDEYCVRCGCGMSGPQRSTPRDAARLWNTRSAQEPGATAPVAGTSGGGSADREAAATAPEPAQGPDRFGQDLIDEAGDEGDEHPFGGDPLPGAPALRPMAEAPRDGTWVLVRFRDTGAFDPAGPSPPLHLVRWITHYDHWVSSGGLVKKDSAFAGWFPLPGSEDGWRPTHRHRKGGRYRLLTDNALIEATMQPAVVYEAVDGQWWVRPSSEFFDGRFTPLPPEGER